MQRQLVPSWQSGNGQGGTGDQVSPSKACLGNLLSSERHHLAKFLPIPKTALGTKHSIHPAPHCFFPVCSVALQPLPQLLCLPASRSCPSAPPALCTPWEGHGLRVGNACFQAKGWCTLSLFLLLVKFGSSQMSPYLRIPVHGNMYGPSFGTVLNLSTLEFGGVWLLRLVPMQSLRGSYYRKACGNRNGRF